MPFTKDRRKLSEKQINVQFKAGNEVAAREPETDTQETDETQELQLDKCFQRPEKDIIESLQPQCKPGMSYF